MVIVKIMGGLGNQMFQYAFARSLESKIGHKVLLDISYYQEVPEADTIRREFITRFPHEFEIASEEQIRWMKERNGRLWNRALGKLGLYKSNLIMENEEDIQLHEFKGDQVYLIGYWQAEKYFKNISDMLRLELDFAEWQRDEESEEILRQIRDCEVSAAFHVRAGDYLEKANQECFGNICTEQYYKKAYQHIKERYPQCRFFLFTNDTEWVLHNMDLPFNDMEIVRDNEHKQEWVDLFLMSQCNHNVIANSSYSWWAAWLNPHLDKIIICPSKWTNYNFNQDTICDGWVRIDAK